jgi:16S rRNA (guanine966-N2)-methyltransferase
LRVIAGAARRVQLVAPAGTNTRPTADRAKESLFNILGGEVRGAKFLDIFCGSGAVGLEALSRGASEAVFIENNSQAIKAVKENITKTKLSKAEILEMSAENAIKLLSAQNRKFDIIFLDPPYASDFLHQTLHIIQQSNILAQNGQIIAETETTQNTTPEAEITLTNTVLTDTRIYGRTCFLFYRAETV